MTEKYSIEDVRSVVENEGLGYAIESYLGADWIENAELAELWRQAADVLSKISSILELED